jgi:hypothetical protein
MARTLASVAVAYRVIAPFYKLPSTSGTGVLNGVLNGVFGQSCTAD